MAIRQPAIIRQPVVEGLVTRLSWWIFNCYVLHGQQPIIVDPGLPTLANAAAELVERAENPPIVIATHCHSDHVGGFSTLAGLGATDLRLPAVAEHWQSTGCPSGPGIGEVVKILPMFADQPFSVSALLEVGRCSRRVGVTPKGLLLDFKPTEWCAASTSTTTPIAGTAWELLATPGHTGDSMSLINEHYGVLISGDAVLSHRGRAWFNPELADRQATSETANALRERTVQVLCPGHGLPVSDRNLWANSHPWDQPFTHDGLLTAAARRLGNW